MIWSTDSRGNIIVVVEEFAKCRADLFNVFDNQTGYSANPLVTSELFGQPRNFYNPRRIQLAVGIEF